MFGSTRKEPEQPDPSGALVREVGAQLRQARLERGEELEDVAEFLRIRPTYLYGLEQGDLSVIPGRTYALGFLRSYAQYLGFDGDDLIAQIRSSVADLTGGAHLHGRTPLSESRLPKVPILVVSLAALAGVYAGWAYVDGRDSTEIELVAEVPDDLQEVRTTAPEKTPSQAGAIEAPRPEATESNVGAAIAPEAGLSDGADGSVSSAQALTAAPSADARSSAPSPAHVASEPAQPVQEQAAATPPAGVAADQMRAVQMRAPVPQANAATGPSRAASDQAVVAPSATADPGQVASDQDGADAPERHAADVLANLEPVAAAGAVPKIYRTDDAATRVILRARSSAWVHVSSTNNDYLWVKTLQPGDAFVVPDRSDLVLWTGNAGGIEVIVDGAPLPPLGREADVVRDVSLQPRALLRRLLPAPAAGAASGQQSGGQGSGGQ